MRFLRISYKYNIYIGNISTPFKDTVNETLIVTPERKANCHPILLHVIEKYGDSYEDNKAYAGGTSYALFKNICRLAGEKINS